MFTRSRFASLGAARHNAKYGNRTVPSERMPVERPDVANGRLEHASVLQVKSATHTRAELAAREKRRQEMFDNLQQYSGPMPSARRGRGGVDITATDNFRVLSSLPVDPNKRNPVVNVS